MIFSVLYIVTRVKLSAKSCCLVLSVEIKVDFIRTMTAFTQGIDTCFSVQKNKDIWTNNTRQQDFATRMNVFALSLTRVTMYKTEKLRPGDVKIFLQNISGPYGKSDIYTRVCV